MNSPYRERADNRSELAAPASKMSDRRRLLALPKKNTTYPTSLLGLAAGNILSSAQFKLSKEGREILSLVSLTGGVLCRVWKLQKPFLSGGRPSIRSTKMRGYGTKVRLEFRDAG
jgi:hypothetical protein